MGKITLSEEMEDLYVKTCRGLGLPDDDYSLEFEGEELIQLESARHHRWINTVDKALLARKDILSLFEKLGEEVTEIYLQIHKKIGIPDHDYSSDGYEGKELGQCIYSMMQALGETTSQRFEIYKKLEFADDGSQRHEQRLEAIGKFLENCDNIYSVIKAVVEENDDVFDTSQAITDEAYDRFIKRSSYK